MSELVGLAADGDQGAWRELVGRYSGLVWSVARSHNLSHTDADEVSQTTWLRLVEHLGRLRDPERVGGWLAATARHESARVLRRAGREVLEDSPQEDVEFGNPEPGPEARLLESERRELLMKGLAELSDRCRRLLRVLASAPPPSYAEVSDALGIPVGSIGPTRARCLENLRRILVAQGAVPHPGGGS
ncbi:MAG: sigma-70 family RNA polymerase sigma factor [Streptosporangiales bacterium]|nr:sigma-70 family RNA polymerase sigma factor [Streptosporangiales bacterium]